MADKTTSSPRRDPKRDSKFIEQDLNTTIQSTEASQTQIKSPEMAKDQYQLRKGNTHYAQQTSTSPFHSVDMIVGERLN